MNTLLEASLNTWQLPRRGRLLSVRVMINLPVWCINKYPSSGSTVYPQSSPHLEINWGYPLILSAVRQHFFPAVIFPLNRSEIATPQIQREMFSDVLTCRHLQHLGA
jgi:hypothetical protein